MGRKRLPAVERREQIIEAARPLFVAGGRTGTRTRDIAAAAGINEALIYEHFRSKDELFDAAIVAPLERIVAKLAADPAGPSWDARGRPQRAATERSLRSLLAVMAESLSLFGVVLFSDQGQGRDFYRGRLAPVLDQMIDAVKGNLASWPHREFDPTRVVTAGFWMCWGLALDAAYRDEALDVDAVAAEITDLIFNGVQGMRRTR